MRDIKNCLFLNSNHLDVLDVTACIKQETEKRKLTMDAEYKIPPSKEAKTMIFAFHSLNTGVTPLRHY